MTYRFLDDVFGELAALTPGPYLHIGGDEAKTLDPRGLRDDRRAGAGDRRRARQDGDRLARDRPAPRCSPPRWSSSGGPRPDAPEVVAAAERGTKVIMSPANRAYLDMKYDAQHRARPALGRLRRGGRRV